MTKHRKYRIPKLEELEVDGLFTFIGKNGLNKIINVDNGLVTYLTDPITPKSISRSPTSSVQFLLEEHLHLIDHWMGPSDILVLDTLDEYKQVYDDDFKTCLRSELILVMGYVVADEKYEVTISPSSLEKIMGLKTIEQYISVFPGSPIHAQTMYNYMKKWNQIPVLQQS